jgi:hypothetical protein
MQSQFPWIVWSIFQCIILDFTGKTSAPLERAWNFGLETRWGHSACKISFYLTVISALEEHGNTYTYYIQIGTHICMPRIQTNRNINSMYYIVLPALQNRVLSTRGLLWPEEGPWVLIPISHLCARRTFGAIISRKCTEPRALSWADLHEEEPLPESKILIMFSASHYINRTQL